MRQYPILFLKKEEVKEKSCNTWMELQGSLKYLD